MEIKDTQGNILFDAPVTQSAVLTEELMKQYGITLGWNAVTADVLPVGAYIEHNGVRYSLLEPYSPTQKDEATYEYSPVFQHPVMRWGKALFFFYTYSGGSIVSKELDWSLTDNPANFMSAICDAIENETGEKWSYEVASDLAASASLSFSNTDIFSALNSIADAFETEWWFDYANKVVYLSKAGHGSAVTLEVGQNVGVPQVTQNKEGYYTRFYGFGSTRNIDQSYAGANVNSIVNRRLTLDPAKYPNGYIDIREGLTQEEVLSVPLVFDDIYPRSSLTISDVKVRLMWRLDDNSQKVQIGTDSEGNPVYDQYAIWYFKIPGFTFSKDLLISGKSLSAHFNSGPLNGREFELTYHDKDETLSNSDGTDFVVEAGDYEINFVEEGTFIIPAITGLAPVDGNSITLFNIIMPEEYKASAYAELEEAVRKRMAQQEEDRNNYSFESNKVAFYESNPNLSIGRLVTFVNGSNSISTRVIKLETQLDYPFEQRITVGNAIIKGSQQTLKEEVVNANQNIDLLAAINESTEAFQQALQRTQKSMQDAMAKIGDMWYLDPDNEETIRTKFNVAVDKAISFGGVGSGSGSGSGTGVSSLYALTEVMVNRDTLANGQSLIYENGSWVNKAAGLNESQLWNILASNTTEQINISHIPDLSGKYLPLSGGEIRSTTSINPFNINSGSGSVYMLFKGKDVQKASVGYYNSFAYVGIDTTESTARIGVTYEGIPQYWTAYDGTKYDLLHSGNYNSYALPLTGGVLKASGKNNPLIVRSDGYDYVRIGFGVGTNNYASLVYSGGLDWKVTSENWGSEATLIHSNNIGSYNAGSATKLQNNTAFYAWGQTFFENGTPKNITSTSNLIFSECTITPTNIIYTSRDGGWVHNVRVTKKEDGTILGSIGFFGNDDGLNRAYIVAGDTSSTNGLIVLDSGDVGIGTLTPAYKFHVAGVGLFGDSTDGSAVALGKKGNAIDGYYLGLYGNLYINANSPGNVYIATGGGKVGIKTNKPAYDLDVAGAARITETLRIGSATLRWDDENQCLIVDKNFASEQAISFGGVGSSTGGSTGVTSFYALPEIGVDTSTLAAGQSLIWDGATWTNRVAGLNESQLWNLLSANTTEQINISHIPDLSSKYLPLSGGRMSGYIRWQNDVNGNDVLDWDAERTNFGLKIMSSGGSSTGIPTTYATALQVRGRYGFQIASAGGNYDLFYIKNIAVEGREWKELYHTGNFNPANYLPLSGGELGTGSSHTALRLLGNASQARLGMQLDGQSSYAYIIYSGASNWSVTDLGVNNTYALIHSGNIGTQQVEAASTFAYKIRYSSSGVDLNTLNTGGMATNYGSSAAWVNAPEGMLFGAALNLKPNGYNSLQGQLAWDVNHASTTDTTRFLWWRASDDGTFTEAKWHRIAFTTSNVASATKLQNNTAFYAWGQTFFKNGVPVGISNAMLTIWKTPEGSTDEWRQAVVARNHYNTPIGSVGFKGVGDNLSYAYLLAGNFDYTNGLIVYSNGNVLMGTTTDNGYKLDVAGSIRTTGALIANSAKITTNIRVGGDNIYNYISTRTTEGYNNLSIDSHGDKICISGQSNTVLNVNYTKTESGWAPKTWNWYNGSSTGWANFVLGGITANGEIILADLTGSSSTSYKLRFLRKTSTDNAYDFGLYAQTTKGLTFFRNLSGTDTDIAYLDNAGNFEATGGITATALTINGVGKVSGNLTTTNIYPDADASYNLGSTSKKWYQVHMQEMYANSGRIYGDLRLQPKDGNYGSHLYIGDGSYCYIAELGDDIMTLYAKDGIIFTVESTKDDALKINANTYIDGNFITTGAITFGSDERYKTKLSDVSISLEDIANAPLFNYRWMDRKDNREHLGTTAQYWNKTAFRNAVCPNDEKLWTMSYSEIAMGNTIVLARELLPIKREVSKIEKLENRVSKLERILREHNINVD